MTGPPETARSHRAEAAALVDGLSDDELSPPPDAAAWLAAAELYLDLYAEADDAREPRSPARPRDGAGELLPRADQILPGSGTCAAGSPRPANSWTAPSRLGACSGHHAALAGNLFNRSVIALAVGDLELALATAEEALELTRDLDDRLRHAWAAVRLAASCSKPGNRTCRRAASRPRRWRGADAHPRRLEELLPRTAHALLARARTARRGRARGG